MTNVHTRNQHPFQRLASTLGTSVHARGQQAYKGSVSILGAASIPRDWRPHQGPAPTPGASIHAACSFSEPRLSWWPGWPRTGCAVANFHMGIGKAGVLLPPPGGRLGWKNSYKISKQWKETYDICEQRQSQHSRKGPHGWTPSTSVTGVSWPKAEVMHRDFGVMGVWVLHLDCAAVLVNVHISQYSCNRGFTMCVPYHILITLQV